MSVAICVNAYDRADLLQKTLQNLILEHPCGADYLVIYVDGSPDPNLVPMAMSSIQWAINSSMQVHVIDGNPNVGIAKACTHAFGSIYDKVDVVIHVDSDILVEQAGWAPKLEKFLMTHHEVGIAGPDIKGRYMRIHRLGYDEIEYCIGMIMAFRSRDYRQLANFMGDGFFDANIGHQWDPDVCYRARMLGHRVGIIDIGKTTHLGEGTGDSSRASACKGGFEFLRKWNLYFTGQFRYKSPMMLRWDEFPNNYLWRRQWLAQFSYNERNPVEIIQEHKFELVQYPITPTKWLLPQTKDALRTNVIFSGEDKYEDVDPELLSGARNWNLGDLKR